MSTTSKTDPDRRTRQPSTTRRHRGLLAAGAAALLLLAVGCLIEESRHTLYLDPDGSLDWVVLERDVRSTETDARAREREEAEFIEQARSGRHAAARALESLDPRYIDTTILREERPFMVHSEASFDDAAELARRALRELELRGAAALERGEGWTRFTLEFESSDLHRWEQAEEPPELLSFLIDPDRFEIRLTEGQFVEAHGFELEDGDRVARLGKLDADEAEPSDGRVVLILTWSTGPAAGTPARTAPR